MPIFPYRCTECGREWDERRDRNDPDLDRSLQACEACVPSGSGARVLVSGGPAIYFHGRGWSRVDKNYRDGE